MMTCLKHVTGSVPAKGVRTSCVCLLYIQIATQKWVEVFTMDNMNIILIQSIMENERDTLITMTIP